VAIKGLAYLRTSSAANVEGDSADRQRAAIRTYAARNGIDVVEEFYDAAVSGTDPVEGRRGFAARSEVVGSRTALAVSDDQDDWNLKASRVLIHTQ
jgi:DNA invertase Pin-like site-specific DNA recombinase